MKNNSRSLIVKVNLIILIYDNQYLKKYNELIEPKNVNQFVMRHDKG